MYPPPKTHTTAQHGGAALLGPLGRSPRASLPPQPLALGLELTLSPLLSPPALQAAQSKSQSQSQPRQGASLQPQPSPPPFALQGATQAPAPRQRRAAESPSITLQKQVDFSLQNQGETTGREEGRDVGLCGFLARFPGPQAPKDSGGCGNCSSGCGDAGRLEEGHTEQQAGGC
jgi:hypothetical protein